MNKLIILILLQLMLMLGCNSSILDDPATKIIYRVEETSHVKLVLLNSYDTAIATLVDEEKSAGNHDVSFSNSNLAEGIYFYTLELKGVSGSYSKSTKHMLLIK